MVSRIHDSLYLGDYDDGKHADEYLPDFHRIISIGPQVDHEFTTDHFEIPDGGFGFDRDEHYPVFKEAVNTLRGALERGETVLVHCNAGQSRSPAVVIALLATEHQMGFNETYNALQEQRRVVNLSPELRYCSKRYIDSYQAVFGEGDENE